MNKLTIIGNLTRDPELRTTATGLSVCTFSVAVSRRRTANGNQEADFFRVTAWRERGEICAKYLAKGSKVCVTAEEVEFLSSRQDRLEQAPEPTRDPETGFEEVEPDELPF